VKAAEPPSRLFITVIPAQAGIFPVGAGFHHEDTKFTKKGTKFFYNFLRVGFVNFVSSW
jgi:hypothetical protein